MIKIGKLSLGLAIAIFCGMAVVPGVKADPVFFSNVVASQNEGSSRLDLFSNPGATLIGPHLVFLVDLTGTLPPGVTQTLLITYMEVGGVTLTRSFEIPAFGTLQPPYTNIVSFDSPGANYQGVMASLRVDIIDNSPDFVIPSGPNAGQMVDSYTYQFKVAQPVPEPLSLVLFGTGLFGVWRRTSRRRRRSTRD